MNRLRAIRRHKNMTQVELAKAAGVSPRTVHAAEKGHRTRHDTQRRICEVIGLPWALRGEVFK